MDQEHEKNTEDGPSLYDPSGRLTGVSSQEDNLLASDVRPAAEARLVRTMDVRLLPVIILIFIMNYIDRVAVASARLQGMSQDLGLTDFQYENVLAVLYASYVPVQVPSNMIVNRISRPSYYISGCVVTWGLISALTGITSDYASIITARIFLGIPEAAFFPGALYLLSRWYNRKELALRIAILYGGLLTSNAFGGASSLMAAGILSRMEGKLGIRAWRWLFYIEGSITVFIGIVSIFLLPDHPHNTRWLKTAQRRLAQVRLAEDAGEADEDAATESAWTGVIMALKEPKVLIFFLLAFSQLLGGGFLNFFPTIAGTLGFSTTVTLLLTAPPWILATALTVVNAWDADRTGDRFFHCCMPQLSMIVGYIIGVSTSSVGGRYVAMFFMAGGYAGFPMTLAWVASSIPRPPAKRTAAIAIVSLGNLGALTSSYVWKIQWSPGYHPSMFIGIAAIGFSVALGCVMRWLLVHENGKLDREELESLTDTQRGRVEEAARLEGITVKEAMRRRQGFRYLI